MATGVTAGERIERIAIVIPMYNEEAHVDHLVEDLAAQDFEGDVHVIVADGRSTDRSVERLEAAAARAGVRLTVVDNPTRWITHGLNRALARADGDLIVRLDCHSRYPSDYLSACARVSEETGAWNVGGLFEVEAESPDERAFACALETPFGGHNWTRLRDERHDADTVFCGAFRPFVFERVGTYDESLEVAEVEDLNLRIRLAGGRVVYDPSIRLRYVPRGSLRGVFRQYYRYGLWKAAVTAKFGRPLSGRSVVPLAFVGSVAGLGALAPWSPAARRLLALELATYGAAAVAFGAEGIRRRGESWELLPRVVAHFPVFHAAHGLGGLHGWGRQLRRRFTSTNS